MNRYTELNKCAGVRILFILLLMWLIQSYFRAVIICFMGFVSVYTLVMRLSLTGISDFSLRVALQTLLREYTEVNKSPKESKHFSLLQTTKTRPRRKARKYLYAIGT